MPTAASATAGHGSGLTPRSSWIWRRLLWAATTSATTPQANVSSAHQWSTRSEADCETSSVLATPPRPSRAPCPRRNAITAPPSRTNVPPSQAATRQFDGHTATGGKGASLYRAAVSSSQSLAVRGSFGVRNQGGSSEYDGPVDKAASSLYPESWSCSWRGSGCGSGITADPSTFGALFAIDSTSDEQPVAVLGYACTASGQCQASGADLCTSTDISNFSSASTACTRQTTRPCADTREHLVLVHGVVGALCRCARGAFEPCMTDDWGSCRCRGLTLTSIRRSIPASPCRTMPASSCRIRRMSFRPRRSSRCRLTARRVAYGNLRSAGEAYGPAAMWSLLRVTELPG
jgi:hypothetical protein